MCDSFFSSGLLKGIIFSVRLTILFLTTVAKYLTELIQGGQDLFCLEVLETMVQWGWQHGTISMAAKHKAGICLHHDHRPSSRE